MGSQPYKTWEQQFFIKVFQKDPELSFLFLACFQNIACCVVNFDKLGSFQGFWRAWIINLVDPKNICVNDDSQASNDEYDGEEESDSEYGQTCQPGAASHTVLCSSGHLCTTVGTPDYRTLVA